MGYFGLNVRKCTVLGLKVRNEHTVFGPFKIRFLRTLHHVHLTKLFLSLTRCVGRLTAKLLNGPYTPKNTLDRL